ncbi:MAG: hypothetical protein KatS3mg109_1935 [Pirellulaceae bacterium]|nr:MAG: hypothetical protein KatS3mg109_1935 [Pirellulaceae bacterium]
MITEYELYSDERYQRHKNSRYLFIGGIICTNKGRERIHRKLEEVRSRFNLAREMRWNRVSRSFLEAYRSWVDVFFEDPFARYSILTVNLSEPDWRNFRPKEDRRPARDDKLASVFYQFLLVSFGPLRDTKRWWVYPDAGFFSRDTVLGRVEFLFNRTYKKAFGAKTSRIIRLARARDSRNEDLIQLADVLLGAIGCHILGSIPTSDARRCLVEHCAERMGGQLETRSGLDRVKSTIWVPPEKFSYPR